MKFLLIVVFLSFSCFCSNHQGIFLRKKHEDAQLVKHTNTILTGDPILDEKDLEKAEKIRNESLNNKECLESKEPLQQKILMREITEDNSVERDLPSIDHSKYAGLMEK